MPDCRNLTNRIITAEGGQQYYPTILMRLYSACYPSYWAFCSRS